MRWPTGEFLSSWVFWLQSNLERSESCIGVNQSHIQSSIWTLLWGSSLVQNQLLLTQINYVFEEYLWMCINGHIYVIHQAENCIWVLIPCWTGPKKNNLLHTHIYAKENIRKKCDTVLEKLEILFSSIYHSTLCNSINITI